MWIRGHHALEVGLEDLQYRVSVEPSKGYQVLRLHGPLDPGADWSSAGFRSVDVVITQEGRVLSTLPAPPWVKGSGEHANAISGDEREITGTVEQLDGNAGINIATVGGTVWHLPWREGTVLESADGV